MPHSAVAELGVVRQKEKNTMDDTKFPPAVLSKLNYYVYLYSDPETHEVFYVGKGTGNRVFSHLEDQEDSNKVKYIKRLRSRGLEPKIEILIHGLKDASSALRVEASIIDLLGLDRLTNQVSGYQSRTFGRMTVDQVVAAYSKEPARIKEPALLIRVNQLFRYNMEPIELYDITRGYWGVKLAHAKDAEIALSVYQGIVQEVYRIHKWFEAGQTFNSRQTDGIRGRYEFIGQIAEDVIRKKYRFKSVEHYFRRGNQNSVHYLNC